MRRRELQYIEVADYITGWEREDSRPIEVKRKVLEQVYPNIMQLIWDEALEYERRFAKKPKFFVLSTSAYQSLYVESRHRGHREAHTASSVMGVDIVLNHAQNKAVMALGHPEDELIYGGLYTNAE